MFDCYSTIEILLYFVVLVIGIYWASDYLGLIQYFTQRPIYGYDERSGPYTWKKRFPCSTGDNQSPINIENRRTTVILSETVQSIRFSENYFAQPKDMALYNDGHTVILCAVWENDDRPSVSAGPLKENYQFLNACFRWGGCDGEGSEHTINSYRYVMELQTFHVNGDSFTSIEQSAQDGTLLIISYFFELCSEDNIYMEPIVNSLKSIMFPFTRVCLEPMPLSWLMPPFSCQYYYYNGSLTYPPCTEGVQWIIQPEPLSISARQVRKFRKILGADHTYLNSNSRPIQKSSHRSVIYYD